MAKNPRARPLQEAIKENKEEINQLMKLMDCKNQEAMLAGLLGKAIRDTLADLLSEDYDPISKGAGFGRSDLPNERR